MSEQVKTIEEQIAENVAQLSVGQVAVVAFKRVINNKISVEFAEKMVNNNNSEAISALSLFNAGDPKFAGKARRAWVVGTVDNIAKLLNLDAEDLAAINGLSEGEVHVDTILNPSIELNGIKHFAKIRIRETTTPTEYQAANVDTTAKRRGTNGEFMLHKGKYIFSNTDVQYIPEGKEVAHVKLEADDTSIIASVNAEETMTTKANLTL